MQWLLISMQGGALYRRVCSLHTQLAPVAAHRPIREVAGCSLRPRSGGYSLRRKGWRLSPGPNVVRTVTRDRAGDSLHQAAIRPSLGRYGRVSPQSRTGRQGYAQTAPEADIAQSRVQHTPGSAPPTQFLPRNPDGGRSGPQSLRRSKLG